MQLEYEPTPATPHLKPVRVVTESGWPVVLWEGNRRSTILALIRSWHGQEPRVGTPGWCVYFEVTVRDRPTLCLVLDVNAGAWYLEAAP